MGAYTQNWQRYRSLRRTALLFALGIVPVAWLLRFLHEPPGVHTMRTSLLALYGLFWMIAALRFEFFPCPRCGQAFATTWLYNRGFFASECVHCGLPKYDPGDVD
ncbi:MAG TPA: hypothetical protein VFU68_02895 [Terracidiphilus sp.]|nr:hypothetical protein [Terracidiphilus sp.]